MLLSRVEDEIKCRTFPTSLRKAALQWFINLLPGSVASFDQLVEQFTARFFTSIAPQKTSAVLATLRQEEGEPLRAYIQRFTAFSLQIKDLKDEVAVHTLMAGLQRGRFRESITLNPLSSLQELLQLAGRYINLEEVERSAPRPTRHKKPIREKERRPRPYHTRYSLLNKPRSEVLHKICHTRLAQLPPPTKTRPAPGVRMYCEYHRGGGHSIEECQALKDLIEDLLKKGHMRHFIFQIGQSSRPGEPRYRLRERQLDRQPWNSAGDRRAQDQSRQQGRIFGVINTISGVFASGWATSGEQRRHYRAGKRYYHQVNEVGRSQRIRAEKLDPPITFTEEDYGEIQREHDDPVVIEAMVANFQVKKILVDQGSSADILFLKEFEQMAIARTELQGYQGSLIRFSGTEAPVLGTIRLQATFGGNPD